jgi:hypothetical protein
MKKNFMSEPMLYIVRQVEGHMAVAEVRLMVGIKNKPCTSGRGR